MFSLIEKVKEKNPLVVHYTNNVTMNDCANTTLAIGASPLMSLSYEEVEEVISISDAVVINIGTMNSNALDLYLLAGKTANKYNKPVILDPVGVFATKTRSEFVNKLLNEIKFDVIKGNNAEIKYIGGFDVHGKGVDSFDDEDDVDEIAKRVAIKLDCTIASTGKIDTITDGRKVYKIKNGSEMLKNVTGTGCMSGSLIGSFLGTGESVVQAATMGVLTMSLSGELASEGSPKVGTFKVKLMDEINSININTLNKYARVDILK